MKDIKWSKTEKKIARQAFDKAYEHEIKHIENEVREMLDKSEDVWSVWHIHDFLTKKRKETDQKYDYRYSVLITVFSHLYSEGWLLLEDLKGLDEDKIERIQTISKMIYEQAQGQPK